MPARRSIHRNQTGCERALCPHFLQRFKFLDYLSERLPNRITRKRKPKDCIYDDFEIHQVLLLVHNRYPTRLHLAHLGQEQLTVLGFGIVDSWQVAELLQVACSHEAIATVVAGATDSKDSRLLIIFPYLSLVVVVCALCDR